MSNLSLHIKPKRSIWSVTKECLAALLLTAIAIGVILAIHNDWLSDVVASPATSTGEDISFVGDALTSIRPINQVVVEKQLLEPDPLVGPALTLKQSIPESANDKVDLLLASYCKLSGDLFANQPVIGWGETGDAADQRSKRLTQQLSDLSAEGEFLYEKLAKAELPRGADFPAFNDVVTAQCKG